MIVQSAPEGHAHFVIMQADHARMSGQLAAAFGNEAFATFAPREPVIYAVAHHDEGWLAVDAAAERDPDTGLPYNLTKTPLARLIDTGSASPDHNEAHHAYSGLLSSMHTWGLYHGRYGLSDFLFIDRITPDLKPVAEAMLDNELARQERLKSALRADPVTAPHSTEAAIFQNYKLLQFFDTLSLYFHMSHADQRGEAEFRHIPQSPAVDVTLTIRPAADGNYMLDPWPFATPDLTVSVVGRYLSPLPANADVPAVLAGTASADQHYTLVPNA